MMMMMMMMMKCLRDRKMCCEYIFSLLYGMDVKKGFLGVREG
jgi:hypothetical protein